MLLAGFLLQLPFVQDAASNPYMNPRLATEQRAASLLRMSLAEKAAEMQSNAIAVPRLRIPAYQCWSEATSGPSPLKINFGKNKHRSSASLRVTTL